MNIFHILAITNTSKIFLNIFAVIACFAIGYLFGAFPTSVVIGKIFFHQDPRDFGSHNPGGTNAGRLWGRKVGFIVICLDMIKTILPMWLCWAACMWIKIDGKELCPTVLDCGPAGVNLEHLVPWPVYWLATFGCMVGHCWPAFAQFKGGKGVSCYMGVLVTSSWLIGFIPGVLYFIFLKLTKYVSLAGILVGIISVLMAWIWAILWGTGCLPESMYSLSTFGTNLITNYVYAIDLTVMAAIMIGRHHENIDRLIHGCERRITWMS